MTPLAKPVLWILALHLAAVAGSAQAQNLKFLEKAPIAFLTEQDKTLLQQAWNEALNDGADGETITWHNEETGHEGSIRPLDTHEDFGTTCRTVSIQTRAGGMQGGGRYRLCLSEDGSWRFAPLRKNRGARAEQG